MKTTFVRRYGLPLLLALTSALLLLASRLEKNHQNENESLLFSSFTTTTTTEQQRRQLSSSTSTTTTSSGIKTAQKEETKTQQKPRDELIQELAQKLTPREDFRWHKAEKEEEEGEDYGKQQTPRKQPQPQREGILEKHQFLHLHHMKTGGTSMDHLIKCAMTRLEHDSNRTVPYGSIHECSRRHYDSCKSKDDLQCNQKLQDASIMSYCAPLKDLPAFGWAHEHENESSENNEQEHPHPPIDALTVLRHPVDRVWSMYRYQTKNCFGCVPLLDIYQAMDAGESIPKVDRQCTRQLVNHQVTNLLSHQQGAGGGEDYFIELSSTKSDDTVTDEEKRLLEQAISNMKSFFTLIGLTEQLNATVQMAGMVFPWMNETVNGSELTCPLPHANASPKNNRCGEHYTHWDLPSHPDEATRKAIEAHNQLDLQLYEAAKEHFELQKEALGL